MQSKQLQVDGRMSSESLIFIYYLPTIQVRAIRNLSFALFFSLSPLTLSRINQIKASMHVYSVVREQFLLGKEDRARLKTTKICVTLSLASVKLLSLSTDAKGSTNINLLLARG